MPKDADTLEQAILSLAFGVAMVPIVVMVLTLLYNSLNVYTAYFTTLIVLVANAVIHRHNIKGILHGNFRLRIELSDSLTVFLFIAIFAIHLSSAVGLYVHPGDDPKLYSLITLRIVESGGYTTSWGEYAYPSWYHEKIHLTIAGFSGTSAYFYELTMFDIGKIVLLLTLIIKSMISLGIYFLAKRIFQRRTVGLLSALSFALLLREPIFGWFDWGGHAEISSLFLLPIQLGLYIHYLDKGERRIGELVVIAFITAGLAVLHPFSVIYSLACILPCTAYFIVRRRSIFQPLEALLVLPISAIFILPMLLTAIQEELAIMPLYSSTPSPVWTPIITPQQTPEQMFFSALNRIFAVYGPGTFLIYLLGLDQTLHSAKEVDTKPHYVLALWGLTLFLLSENNPNGLFTIEFPLWYRLDSNRTFVSTSLPMSIAIGFGLSTILEKKTESARFLKRLWVRGLSYSTDCQSVIVILLIATQLCLNGLDLGLYRNDSPVTRADAMCFDWIANNTPKDAVFFAFPNDAGQWLPIYTNRRVVIPFGVATRHEAMNEYYKRIYPRICQDPHDIQVLNYLNDANVTQVYIGSRTTLPGIYGNVPSAASFSSSPVYILAHNYDGAYVFNYTQATFKTLWDDGSFTSGWEFGGWPEYPIVVLRNETLNMRTSSSYGYAQASHKLSADNSRSFIYLEIRWRTENETTLRVELTIDGKPCTLIDRTKSLTWSTTIININNYWKGELTEVKIFVDGSGYGSVDYIAVKELEPSRK